MSRHAITFRIKPGTTEQVKALLSSYEPPEHETPDGARLLQTSIFVKDDVVVRVMEIEGPLPSIMRHLSTQPTIQQLERDLDPYLAEPRDMSSPEGAKAFFGRALMDHVLTRTAERGGADMSAGSFIVTGATGAVGEVVIRHLLERGDRLMLVGRDGDALAALQARYADTGRVETFTGNVLDPGDAQEAAAQAARRLDGLSGLVHLVGSFKPGPLMLTDVSAYEDLLAANFLSAVVATQAVLPHLIEGGRLVYFGTPLVTEPLAGLSGYSAAKAALMTWVRSMSHEVKNRGIHANVVSLTLVETEEMRRDRPEVPREHTVEADLVARAVGFLTSPESDGLYGSIVPVVGRFSYTSALAGGPPAGRPPAAGRTGSDGTDVRRSA